MINANFLDYRGVSVPNGQKSLTINTAFGETAYLSIYQYDNPRMYSVAVNGYQVFTFDYALSTFYYLGDTPTYLVLAGSGGYVPSLFWYLIN